jgi:hypothetical protein
MTFGVPTEMLLLRLKFHGTCHDLSTVEDMKMEAAGSSKM